ncbi:MAG TPA: thiol:disulfide interchange protein DsbA/DsbL [Steroidobacteraceae bacterium]
MRKFVMSMLSMVVLSGAVLAGMSVANGAEWTEGKHYSQILPPQHTSVPAGKVEVTEVFSYGCPACNHFQPTAEKIKRSLPANAQMNFVPASFNPSEDWPLFQRAYFAAQALGVAEKTHAAMFSAIWTTGELAVSDPRTNRLKNPLPNLEDVAKFYARVGGVKPEQFVATAKSFSVELDMKRADDWIKASRVDSTPTIVVNGKYRVNSGSVANEQELIELVQWLVAKESGR